MKTVIFGCGKIAKRIAKGFEFVKGNQLVGFASHDLEKAKAYAQEFNLTEYGNYEDFLKRKDIDAIYIATYNLNHHDLVIECLKHHKNVICEKPMPLSSLELDEMFKVAKDNHVLLMEALKSVFLPMNIEIKKMLKENLIGKISHIEASFVRNGHHPLDHWIQDPKCGCLKDLGNYCVGTINFLLDQTPTILYKKKNATNTKADCSAELILDYQGINAHILVSNEIDGDSALKLYGTDGYLVLPDFWKKGYAYMVKDNIKTEFNFEMINDFYYEIQHFSDCLNNKKSESEIMSYSACKNIIKINE